MWLADRSDRHACIFNTATESRRVTDIPASASASRRRRAHSRRSSRSKLVIKAQGWSISSSRVTKRPLAPFHPQQLLNLTPDVVLAQAQLSTANHSRRRRDISTAASVTPTVLCGFSSSQIHGCAFVRGVPVIDDWCASCFQWEARWWCTVPVSGVWVVVALALQDRILGCRLRLCPPRAYPTGSFEVRVWLLYDSTLLFDVT